MSNTETNGHALLICTSNEVDDALMRMEKAGVAAVIY